MTIQATATGTSTQMGKLVNVNISMEQFSTVDDRGSLIDAFEKSGQDGMVKVLQDMKPHGPDSGVRGVVPRNAFERLHRGRDRVGADTGRQGLRHSAARMQTEREQEEATGRDRDLSKPWKLSNFIVSKD